MRCEKSCNYWNVMKLDKTVASIKLKDVCFVDLAAFYLIIQIKPAKCWLVWIAETKQTSKTFISKQVNFISFCLICFLHLLQSNLASLISANISMKATAPIRQNVWSLLVLHKVAANTKFTNRISWYVGKFK